MADQEQAWAYIGRMTKTDRRHAIHMVVCATVDRAEYRKENAKEVAKWMRDGLAVERVPVEWVRENLLTTNRYAPEATNAR